MDELTGSDARRNALSSERVTKRSRSAIVRARRARRRRRRLGGQARTRRGPAAAVLGRAHARGRRSARSLAVLRSAQSLPALVGRSQHQRRGLRPAAARRLRAALEALPRGGAARRFLAAASRVRILSGGGRGRRRRALRSFRSIARDRALHLSAASRRRTFEPRRLSPRTGRRSRYRRRCVAGRHGRERAAATHRSALRARANTANRTSCTASRYNRPKRSPRYVHRRIRRELGLADDRGKRYSWGYGACPDLAQHEIVFRLLDATARIGVTLDASASTRARTIDRRDRHPSSARYLLQRRGGSRTRIA